MQITNRYDNSCLWEGEAIDMRDAVQKAAKGGTSLQDANLWGANLQGAKISSLRVFTGLYKYLIFVFVTDSGVPWVRMGCFWKTVEDWDKLGIRQSNLSEFPDDRSPKSEERALAFEFARVTALQMAKEWKQG